LTREKWFHDWILSVFPGSPPHRTHARWMALLLIPRKLDTT